MDKYLVVDRGLVGSIFLNDSQFDVVSHDEWYNHNLDDYNGMMCTAAISTEAECQKVRMEDVLKANVELPLQMLQAAKSKNAPLVAFSTAGVYQSAGVRVEDDDVDAHNRYTTSKIVMEYALMNETYSRLFIFRAPFVVLFSARVNDLGQRVQTWAKCEDVTASIVYRADLRHAVIRALDHERPVAGGIYNIASGIVHFPTFLEDRFGWQGTIVPPHSLSRTPNSQIAVHKANAAGLLHE